MHATLSRSRVTTDDGRIELDTRSFLHHDLVHLAVEGELGLDGGFWGNVAAGSSLAVTRWRAIKSGWLSRWPARCRP